MASKRVHLVGLRCVPQALEFSKQKCKRTMSPVNDVTVIAGIRPEFPACSPGVVPVPVDTPNPPPSWPPGVQFPPGGDAAAAGDVHARCGQAPGRRQHRGGRAARPAGVPTPPLTPEWVSKRHGAFGTRHQASSFNHSTLIAALCQRLGDLNSNSLFTFLKYIIKLEFESGVIA